MQFLVSDIARNVLCNEVIQINELVEKDNIDKMLIKIHLSNMVSILMSDIEFKEVNNYE